MPNFATPVSEYMTAPVHSVGTEDDLERVHDMLARFGVSSLAVTGGSSELIGVVSRTDLLHVGTRRSGSRHRSSLLNLPKKDVGKIMTKTVETLAPADPLSLAARRMVDQRIHRIFVTVDGLLEGVLSPRDLMSAIADVGVKRPIAELMSTPLFTIRNTDPLSLAVERLEKAHVTGLVVLEQDWPIGLFTQVEALEWREEAQSTPVDEVMSNALLCLDETTPLFRAAAQAASMDVRRVVATKNGRAVGILTGLDFAKAVV